jgi:hypothetical protein
LARGFYRERMTSLCASAVVIDRPLLVSMSPRPLVQVIDRPFV